MNKLSNNSFIDIFIKLLILSFIAKFIALCLLWFLPMDSVEMNEDQVSVMPYHRVNFHNMLELPKGSKAVRKEQKNRFVSNALSINNLLLIGLYGNEKQGYIVVATKRAPSKTDIISIGESYKGYQLKKIFLNYVIFTRHAKEYILRLENKIKPSSVTSSINAEDENEDVSVQRKDILYYSKNPSQIWRDIAISEVKKDGKIIGFRVGKIRKNSKIAQLGLHRGDIIIKANGQPLHSYSAAMKLYEKIDKIKELSLIIKRGNEEKEIIYEIN